MQLFYLDKSHLSNPLFMKEFASKFIHGTRKKTVLLHSDSSYTDDLKKNGLDSDNATLRATKEINIKLINILAEAGISATGRHGYQKEWISLNKENELQLNSSLTEFPDQVVLVLSNLIFDQKNQSIIAYPSSKVLDVLSTHIDEVYAFADSENVNGSFKNQSLSEIELLNQTPIELLDSKASLKLLKIGDLVYANKDYYSVLAH